MPQAAQHMPDLSLALPAQVLTQRRETMKQAEPMGAPATPPRKAPKRVPARKGKAGNRKITLVPLERVAAMLKLSAAEVDRLLDEGRIPFSEVRGQRMVEFNDAVAYAYAVDREKNAEACQAMEDGAVTIEQAARYLGMPVTYLAGRIEAGDVPVHEDADGGSILRSEDVLAFKERRKVEKRAAVAELIRMTAEFGAYEREAELLDED